MNHDTGRVAIEDGPFTARARGASWEDDEPGGPCSVCRGDGTVEHPDTLQEFECLPCCGSGVAW